MKIRTPLGRNTAPDYRRTVLLNNGWEVARQRRYTGSFVGVPAAENLLNRFRCLSSIHNRQRPGQEIRDRYCSEKKENNRYSHNHRTYPFPYSFQCRCPIPMRRKRTEPQIAPAPETREVWLLPFSFYQIRGKDNNNITIY